MRAVDPRAPDYFAAGDPPQPAGVPFDNYESALAYRRRVLVALYELRRLQFESTTEMLYHVPLKPRRPIVRGEPMQEKDNG